MDGAGSSEEGTRTITVATSSEGGDGATLGRSSTRGRYVVIEEIGRGGMGAVLRAYDPKLEREVALKVLHAGLLTTETRARMVREARAMAKLSHPNVVAVYDVEVESAGGVVVVMELVSGQTLRQWMRETRPWRAVVDRFRQAGEGLVAAHDAHLLHRDFKPSNVLVGRDGRVRVTDFGLATSGPSDGSSEAGADVDLVQRETFDSQDLTEVGAVMGTPAYMPPEQHRGGPLSEAADQYAFCAGLWQALTGKLPFVTKGHALVIDKLAGPPAWPTEIAIPQRVVEALRRGLSPDPADRWPSMRALLDALTIQPPMRLRRAFTAAAAVLVVGMAGVGLTDWRRTEGARCSGGKAALAEAWNDGARQAIEAAFAATKLSYSQEMWQRTESRLAGYAKAWLDMHVEACEATAISGQQSAEVLDLRMACLHRSKLELASIVQMLAEADEVVVERAHEVVSGLPALARCADIESLRAEVPTPVPDEAEAVDRIRRTMAESRNLENAAKFEPAYQAALRARDDAAAVAYEPIRIDIEMRLGSLLERKGEYAAAEDHYEAALRHGARWHQSDAVSEAATELVYIVGYRRGRPDEAIALARFARRMLERSGDVKQRARLSNQLAVVLNAQGDYAAAEAEHRRALAMLEEAFGLDHLLVATTRNDLANVLQVQGKYAESETQHRATLSTRLAVLAPDHPEVAVSRNNLANVLHGLGKYSEAEAELRAGLEILTQRLGPDHPHVAASRHNLGVILHTQGDLSAAEEEHRQALAIGERALGPNDVALANFHSSLADLLGDRGEHDEAEIHHRAALALHEASLDPAHPELARSRAILGRALLEQGHVEEAKHLVELAWPIQQRDEVPAEERAHTAFTLARALWETPKSRLRARELAELARAAYAEAGPTHESQLAAVEAWLDTRKTAL